MARILIAEDESALVTLLRYNLEREGYRVLEARDGEEALLVAAEEKPDLVILDWMMPQLSGIEVCRRLRETMLQQQPSSGLQVIGGAGNECANGVESIRSAVQRFRRLEGELRIGQRMLTGCYVRRVADYHIEASARQGSVPVA